MDYLDIEQFELESYLESDVLKWNIVIEGDPFLDPLFWIWIRIFLFDEESKVVSNDSLSTFADENQT